MGPFLYVFAEYLFIMPYLTYPLCTPIIYSAMCPLSVRFFSLVSFFLFFSSFVYTNTYIHSSPHNNITYIIIRVSHPIIVRSVSRCTSILAPRSHAGDVFPDETERALHFFAPPCTPPQDRCYATPGWVSFAHSTYYYNNRFILFIAMGFVVNIK